MLVAHIRRTGSAALLLAGAMAACAGCDAAPPVGPVSPGPLVSGPVAERPIGGTASNAAVTSARLVATAPLTKELVGSWETQHWLDSSGSRAIVRTYTFTADGRYDYRLARCESSTSCAIEGSERGIVSASGGVLTLVPATTSGEGPRSFPYAVGRDPNVGDLQLHLRLPTGEDDVFYAG